MTLKLISYIEAAHMFKQPGHKEGSQFPQSRGHGLFSNPSLWLVQGGRNSEGEGPTGGVTFEPLPLTPHTVNSDRRDQLSFWTETCFCTDWLSQQRRTFHPGSERGSDLNMTWLWSLKVFKCLLRLSYHRSSWGTNVLRKSQQIIYCQ